MNLLITGASQGIGKALAYEYANAGNSILLLARNESAVKNISEDINNTTRAKCFYKKCDVTNPDDVYNAVRFALEKFNTIDLAILNSGVGGPHWMGDFKSEHLKEVYGVNVFGIAHFLEHLIPLMKNQEYGVIAGVSSLADVRGFAGSGSYASSKAAVSVLLESARLELKKYNIDVITIRPGFVRTAMTAKNEFKMPFLWEPEKAAKKIRKGIERKKSIVQFPFLLVMATRLLRILPNWIYDPLLSNMRKNKE